MRPLDQDHDAMRCGLLTRLPSSTREFTRPGPRAPMLLLCMRGRTNKMERWAESQGVVFGRRSLGSNGSLVQKCVCVLLSLLLSLVQPRRPKRVGRGPRCWHGFCQQGAFSQLQMDEISCSQGSTLLSWKNLYVYCRPMQNEHTDFFRHAISSII